MDFKQAMVNAEQERLERRRDKTEAWARWGPYLSDRQWGTVREDYSPYGTAWEYFPHDTRARARTAGARTASRASATTTSASASRWRFGTATIRSSRSASSA